jgi:pilus assembly protein CpaD
MGLPTLKREAIDGALRPFAWRRAGAAALLLALGGCQPGEPVAEVAGWSLLDPSQRHPIMVSQQPALLTVRVARGAQGLSPSQRAQVIGFLERYRAVDAGNSKLLIEAPSGTSNEVSAMQAVAEVRHLIYEMGFDQTSLLIEAYRAGKDQQPPVRISYLRFFAEAPPCGAWPTNLADSADGLTYPNLGCATQRNFAAMVANPADLLGPRTPTPASAEKRDAQWTKYIKGESTISKKQDEERVKNKEGN